ncbi:dihydrofolate reductase family protein [Paenibacillus lautus]|uniref:dihydrofolate reductase family protein n=1 Tax=Paenibacillus lautus TaxID=1401 RepID=UPI002DB5A260|nr:dihydrofolate reductase family protein [Paenibacillus lautus]MEC0311507.1 dihydrofolate reductase family protein [Paenibacillus lautus]
MNSFKEGTEASSPRKVIYSMMVSLDGFIETEDHLIDWSTPDEELHRYFNEAENEIDIHLYGRRLYTNMASYWPTADLNPEAPDYEIEYARKWKNQKKIVFSTTLDHVDWNSTLVRGNIKEFMEELKLQPGLHMDLGGAGIAASFMEQDLIDEYRLYIHPIVLRGGTPMFHSLRNRIHLQLVESRAFGSGVVLLRYQPKPT